MGVNVDPYAGFLGMASKTILLTGGEFCQPFSKDCHTYALG